MTGWRDEEFWLKAEREFREAEDLAKEKALLDRADAFPVYPAAEQFLKV
jgi:hypothetical protein